MNQKNMVPDDPLLFIRECVKQRSLLWTYHVNMRMQGRYVTRDIILDSTDSYEIIEDYPGDKYLPSYLVYARKEDIIVHILFAVDIEDKNVRIITAYYPDASRWKKDLKTRRKQ